MSDIRDDEAENTFELEVSGLDKNSTASSTDDAVDTAKPRDIAQAIRAGQG